MNRKNIVKAFFVLALTLGYYLNPPLATAAINEIQVTVGQSTEFHFTNRRSLDISYARVRPKTLRKIISIKVKPVKGNDCKPLLKCAKLIVETSSEVVPGFYKINLLDSNRKRIGQYNLKVIKISTKSTTTTTLKATRNTPVSSVEITPGKTGELYFKRRSTLNARKYQVLPKATSRQFKISLKKISDNACRPAPRCIQAIVTVSPRAKAGTYSLIMFDANKRKVGAAQIIVLARTTRKSSTSTLNSSNTGEVSLINQGSKIIRAIQLLNFGRPIKGISSKLKYYDSSKKESIFSIKVSNSGAHNFAKIITSGISELRLLADFGNGDVQRLDGGNIASLIGGITTELVDIRSDILGPDKNESFSLFHDDHLMDQNSNLSGNDGQFTSPRSLISGGTESLTGGTTTQDSSNKSDLAGAIGYGGYDETVAETGASADADTDSSADADTDTDTSAHVVTMTDTQSVDADGNETQEVTLVEYHSTSEGTTVATTHHKDDTTYQSVSHTDKEGNTTESNSCMGKNCNESYESRTNPDDDTCTTEECRRDAVEKGKEKTGTVINPGDGAYRNSESLDKILNVDQTPYINLGEEPLDSGELQEQLQQEDPGTVTNPEP